MLSKCANPACLSPFLYLHEGTIFNIEVEGEPAVNSDGSITRARRLEHYWLCGECARSMTVVYEQGRVITRLARPALTAAKPRTDPAQAA